MIVGLAREEVEQLLVAAEADSPRSATLITLLAYNGLRIDEALSRDVEHLGHQQGHRVLRISRKGGRDALEPLSAPVQRALDAHLGDRAGGALFVDDRGRRMTEAQAWRLVRRLARAARLKSAAQLSPHSTISSNTESSATSLRALATAKRRPRASSASRSRLSSASIIGAASGRAHRTVSARATLSWTLRLSIRGNHSRRIGIAAS